ncbi:MAG TPA: hypothetical protein DER23_00420 [Clostridiales bacterium]|jgi:hypothetical protein|nr:hypothetical protein [Clostridiales bacterium]HCG34783.1 hypothetical protein [Clostridiales bacterium]
MKKHLVLLLVLLLIFCFVLSGCEKLVSTNGLHQNTHATPLTLLLALNDKTVHTDFVMYTDIPNDTYRPLDSDAFKTYFSDKESSPDFSNVESYCIRTAEKKVDEIGIFSLQDPSEISTIQAIINGRIANRFDTYNQKSTDNNTVINQKGKFMYYIIATNAYGVNELLLDTIVSMYNDSI